jgi:tRNA threonylcarbamoyl adenosine modification protein YeaZ
MSTQTILAFDCACVGASVALMNHGNTSSRRIAQTSQAAELVPAIDTLLKAAHVGYSDISCIVSTVGPGSFTGLRIGLATLHGLVLVHKTPIKLLTSLAAMAWKVASKKDAPTIFYTAIRAGKGEIYAQKFLRTGTQPIEMSDITLYAETYDVWDVACFSNALDATHSNYISGPSAQILCRIAEQLTTSSLAEALPLYIRPPDAIIGAPHVWLTSN